MDLRGALRGAPPDAPIRSVLFGETRFAQHGASLAEAQSSRGWRPLDNSFFPRLADNIAALRRAMSALEASASQGRHLSPTAQWLLDNATLIDEQLGAIREALPLRFYRRLPVVRDAALRGLPRIYGIAWAWVAHSDSGFDAALFTRFLAAYQEVQPLTVGELRALHTTLRVVLVENLRRLAERVVARNAARDAAHAWVDGAAVPGDPAALAPTDDEVRALDERGSLGAFLLTLWQRLDLEDGVPQRDAIATWLAPRLPDPHAALVTLQNQTAEDQQSIRHAITTLHTLARTDWERLIEPLSETLRALETSPVHAAEDLATRGATLDAIEALARRSGRSETEVARLLVTLATQAWDGAGEPPANAALAWWWRGPGENTLRARLGLPPRRLPRRASEAWRRAATPAYLLAIALGLAGTLAWVMGAAPRGGPAWLWWLTLLAAAVPLSEACVAVLNRLVSESVAPAQLPRLALARGLGPGERCLVVMPVLLASADELARHVAQLEQHALASPEHEAQFALLSDYADAPVRRLPGDAALLDAAVAAIAALNWRHGADPQTAPRFLLLHRERAFSDSEQRWIGWERKRGKIEALLRVLAEGESAYRPFIELGALSTPRPGVRYLLTLDADTDLLPGRLRELVGIAAHPLHRPRFDAAQRRVVAGYAIVQPRVETPLSAPGSVTPYHALFNGENGLDPYSAAASEVYQDLFGEGSFSGKGLIDVRAAHAALARRFADGQLLSHDLLEGSLARCAAASGVTVFEDAPLHADVAASRLHRWTRGDWQLLLFLFGAGGVRVAAINRWKMLDNLRRSLVAPCALALLLLALAFGALPLATALAVVLAAFVAGPLIGALAALAPSRDDIALARFFAQAGAGLLRCAALALWQLAQLLAQAQLYADAIARALWRCFVSQRLTLQWTTAAAAQAAASTHLPELLRRHWREPALAAALALLLALAARFGAPVRWDAAAPLLTLWALAPVWTWLASRPARHEREQLDRADLDYLRGVARDTWRFYEEHVGAADLHLPPDNVQLVPRLLVAHRTSPTNIGLYLLAVACAREMGFIDTAQMAERIAATLDSVERLPRHHGHLPNWIDTQSGAALQPLYVSAVDSGNLVACLMVLAQACEERAAGAGPDAAGEPARESLRRSARRALALALAVDFRPLYDPRRRLLHIGWHVDRDELDRGHYDLMASEARLSSLVAIAKGDLPAEHWRALGRPTVAVGREPLLRSWSGSMFEYLMPALLLEEPPGSLLWRSARVAVAEQRREARPHGTPWGISESAIALQDHTMAYQYGPQGVARLALRRTPADERVIAPYASGLALLVDAGAAVANLRALEALGARRERGFIESIDYSPQRQADGGSHTLVQTHMSHHQAMLLVAAVSVLSGGAPQAWARRAPHLRAVAGLLHERAPRELQPLRERPAAPPPRRSGREALALGGAPLADALPPTHWLGNRRYGVVLRSNGAGWSQAQGVGLTRWRDDAPRDEHGTFVYLQRGDAAPRHSLSTHPAADPEAHYHCRMLPDRVLFDCRWSDLESRCTVWVSPEDDAELRRVELCNTGARAIELIVHLASEPTLAPQAADEAHPAFSKLFVEAAWDAAEHALWLRRRPRLHGDAEWRAVHALTSSSGPPDMALRVQPCADRRRWLGRHGSAALPLGPGGAEAMPAPADAADAPPALPGRALDTGLDPVAVLSVRLTLAAGASAALTFLCAAGTSQEVLETVVDACRHPQHAERASNLSHTMASILLHDMRIDAPDWAALLRLQTLLSGLHARELPAGIERCDRRALWRHGIGGDRPILAVTIRGEAGLALVHTLLRALPAWTAAGQGVDLVIVNGEPPSYQTPVQHQLLHWLPVEAEAGAARPAVKLLREGELDRDERATLALLARVRLHADGRSLAEQVERLAERHARERARRDAQRARVVETPWRAGVARPARVEAPAVAFDAGDGRCRFAIGAAAHPPRPWINVLANPRFGCHLSEMGGGHTWAGNSRMHQITRWANDPLADPPGEWLLLEDPASGRVWPLGRALQGAGERTVEHGIGFTRMTQRIEGIDITLEWCVDAEAALKQCRIELARGSGGTRALRVVALVEWLLGDAARSRASVATRCIEPRGGGVALLATQLDAAGGFGGATAWLALAGGDDDAPHEWTCDRREFHDARGRLVLPAQLGQAAGPGGDPCAAIGRRVVVGHDRPVTLCLLLGHVDQPAEAGAALAAALAVAPGQRLARQREQWRRLVAPLQVHTPDARFDAMVNHWLPYQTLACRLWARAGYYQAGGAFGFRDQLQDAMALLPLDASQLARQLRASAARQFPEGDVQHWWHEPGGAGVRTHFSDDRVWLAFALAHYVERTGDTALLDEQVPFIEGSPVPDGAEDIYETPRAGDQRATLYEHAARAVDISLASGRHGLPLIGSGDWNDGMNRVGHGGRGESVWLAWFLCATIDAMLPLARRAGDAARERRWSEARRAFAAAVDEHAWDGRWYRRATFDDGSWLGSAANTECRIDLIAQAWSVLSGAGRPQRAATALASAQQWLWDDEHRLLRLLTPPLAHAQPEAGYIQAYAAGVRENGGQYNHAAAWAVMAAAMLQRPDWAWAWWKSASPAHRGEDARLRAAYGGEPYVLAGDIYSAAPWAGQCGWSWYTGSAGWMWRAAVESLIGLSLRPGWLGIAPCLPPHWHEVELRLGPLRLLLVSGEDALARRLAQADCRGALPAREWWPFEDLEEGGFYVVDATPRPAPEGAAAPRPAAEADPSEARR
ncbi:GH36-type glycosyl hydrolase domain-containing protein [Piscinibacter sp.]|uniref:GH36-type glycosyl hydrolase domain-containing protein n=1 Tax=Piscinibacter sp. TaxID=1903157 RepID=UPI0039E5C2EA